MDRQTSLGTASGTLLSRQPYRTRIIYGQQFRMKNTVIREKRPQCVNQEKMDDQQQGVLKTREKHRKQEHEKSEEKQGNSRNAESGRNIGKYRSRLSSSFVGGTRYRSF